jgi:glutamate dehydrogenase
MAGVGDMSGDVFGNGALLSPVTKLVACFNHIHIFIDPDPDPATSFAERKRLFELPRSTWKDYDAKRISKGGGVFDRSAKAIPLSPEMKKMLELDGASASGEEVIRRILTMKVDLLYNGGIGTYIKSASEDNADVGDRANDRVRVDGGQVRARVLGEGANLSTTQRGRLEYWASGGALNTDAVDNSAGVDTSDHEVNIKILMSLLIKKGAVKGKDERNRILAEMTDEVADLVLADNENQARCITLDGLRSAARYEDFVALIEDMVGAGILNRADDAIPTREELLGSPHRDRGLPRPLLAVLLGHTKLWAEELILETGFPDSETGRPLLDAYFPKRLRESFGQHFGEHYLRREIIGTAAINHIVNNAGISYLARTMATSKAGLGDVVTAYIETDRKTGAFEERQKLLAAGRSAKDEQQALLEIEARLEKKTLEALSAPARGKEKAAATR